MRGLGEMTQETYSICKLWMPLYSLRELSVLALALLSWKPLQIFTFQQYYSNHACSTELRALDGLLCAQMRCAKLEHMTSCNCCVEDNVQN